MKILLNILLFICIVVVATTIEVILEEYGVHAIIQSISFGICVAVWWCLKEKIKVYFEKRSRIK